MTWKQPIPVKIPELAGDPFGETLFQVLILRARNENCEVKRPDGTIISLKRGQLLVGREELATRFGLKVSEQLRVYRKLVKLEKVNELLNRQKSKDCTIITIKNYDKFVAMNNPAINQRTNSEQTMNTNKNVKSEKSGEEAAGFSKTPQVEYTQTELAEIARLNETTLVACERELSIFNQWCIEHSVKATSSGFQKWMSNAKNLPKAGDPALSEEEIKKRSIN